MQQTKVDPAVADSNGREDTGAAVSITSKFNNNSPMLVNISGGTITSANNAALYVGHYYSGSTPKYYDKGLALSVTGGKFAGGTDAQAVYIAPKLESDCAAYPDKVISGGYFTTAPAADYVVEGKKAVNAPETCNEYKEGYIYMIGKASSNTVVVSLFHAETSSETGSLSGGGEFNANSYVTVEAKEVANAEFLGWYSDIAGTNKLSGSRTYSFYAALEGEETTIALYAKYGQITGEGKLKAASGSATVMYNGSVLDGETAIANGTSVTLTASGEGSFYGWYDGNGHKLGGDAAYTFTMNGDKTVKAIYNTADSTHAFVNFETNIQEASEGTHRNTYLGGNQMDFGTGDKKDESITTTVNAQPTVPSYLGYEFIGYTVSIGENTYPVDADENGLVNTTQLGDVIKKANSNQTVTVAANYKRSQATYHVRLHFVKDDENNTPLVDAKVLDGTYTVGEAVKVWAENTFTKGGIEYTLAGFKFNDQTFNGAENVTIWPTESQIGEDGNVEVYAIYSDQTSIAAASVNIINAYAETENGVNKIAVTMSYFVPENCTVVETGFYFGKTETPTSKHVGSLTDNNGVYTLHLNVGTYLGSPVYFKAYVTYIDPTDPENSKTVYSSVNNYTWNTLNATAE